MKNLTFTVFLFLISCGEKIKEEPIKKEINTSIDNSNYEVLIIDSCEYIIFGWVPRNDHVITHKGNCKFCKFRMNKSDAG